MSTGSLGARLALQFHHDAVGGHAIWGVIKQMSLVWVLSKQGRQRLLAAKLRRQRLWTSQSARRDPMLSQDSQLSEGASSHAIQLAGLVWVLRKQGRQRLSAAKRGRQR